MIVLFFILLVALSGLGFLNALWWLAAAVLVFVAVRYGRGHADSRGRGDGFEYSDYRDRRDRDNRWERRYRRQRQGLWRRQDRRDEQHHR
ncbi:hypothetical protein GKQ77_18745 [Streptomyces sp. BG9H]|uniref:Hydrophobic protein n=1 Tax=Streptomyces anatolicus TaxID=2675858 RepID=A0ABS6YQ75_9ACTN|nr:hypothetical protein [Streptomyces anatolicus]MBW5423573.1 hypothetical protein [Streptomyces anatolicus]